MTQPAATGGSQPAASRPAMLSPIVDLLGAGGLSILVFVPLLLSGRSDLLIVGAGVQAWVATLFNMPHFMASYRIIYRSKAMILKHKWASIYIPLILFVYALVAMWEAQRSEVLMTLLVAVASIYLAWHYTGQVWGMMASYSHLAGQSFDRVERTLVRLSLRILLAWHVTWFLYTYLRNQDAMRPIYLTVSAATIVAFGIGIVGLAKRARRIGQAPPLQVVVPWLAIFVWYAVMARDPKAIIWVQIAHAIQYLAFPIRMEINRVQRAQPARVVSHMVAYGAVLLVISYLLEQVVPATAMSVVGGMFGEEPGRAAPILLLMFINIHHYFTDGVIWKISNADVRKELFAHVPASPARGAGAGAR